jgi:hypothetical protein
LKIGVKWIRSERSPRWINVSNGNVERAGRRCQKKAVDVMAGGWHCPGNANADAVIARRENSRKIGDADAAFELVSVRAAHG